MLEQIKKYINKLIADGSAKSKDAAIALKDVDIIRYGNEKLSDLAAKVLECLNDTAVLIASPPFPLIDFSLSRAGKNDKCIIPEDSETKTFLHDIPFLKKEYLLLAPHEQIAALLSNRKGIILEGTGIISVGAFTVEQAYANYSSIYHSIFVKFFQDILLNGVKNNKELLFCENFLSDEFLLLNSEGLRFKNELLTDSKKIYTAMSEIGKYTVERGLVDSFFGNISYRNDYCLYISQTGASLDNLEDCIDPVPFDNSSTAGITASSELEAHRKIYKMSDARCILHGHPKFSVIMSMVCNKEGCNVDDCGKNCPEERFIGKTPIVSGEIGGGGLAETVPSAIAEFGKVIVYGHGTFTKGTHGFKEAFEAMLATENFCRSEYKRQFLTQNCFRI
ncbi:MAG: class II aldolase/adducin family protein [Desulfuromonadales bacterium]|nr:class II aldolase/adducin family protein [Desulfuromonadales bacterium]